jgi:hypothetical protein
MLPLLPRPDRLRDSARPQSLWSLSGALRLLFVVSCVPAFALAALVAMLVMPFAKLLGRRPFRLPPPSSRPPSGPAAPLGQALARSPTRRFHG